MKNNRTESLLQTDHLSAGYGKTILVSDISLTVRPGEILALIGPNGAGKSTLLKTIARQLVPLAGTVFLVGKDLSQIKEKDMARTMAVLLTERVRPELTTCRDVVAAGRYPYTDRLGFLDREDEKQVEEAMSLVGITALADVDFSHLSDGQRQRVMLARAIAQQPSVLVLDEPTSYLDIRYKLELMGLLRTLSREKGIAVVMAIHELELAKYIADRLICVKKGRIDRQGSAEEIFTGTYLRELYDAQGKEYEEIYGFLEQPIADRSELTDKPTGADEQKKSVEKSPPAHITGDTKNGYYIRSGKDRLRCGYTTGTCAALGAVGAARLLLSDHETRATAKGLMFEQLQFETSPEDHPDRLPILSLITPGGLTAEAVPEYCIRESDRSARCGIRKDAGDDPDITDGIIVDVRVEKIPSGIEIDGGPGVGRVTKPGLDQPVGNAAINTVPRRMIREALWEVCEETEYAGGLKATVSIPGGEELAKQTLNPALGIEGGLSVLGTTGIVEPMSERALIDTIEVSMKSALAAGRDRVILTPGSYGMAFLQEIGLDRSGMPAIKVSNYLGEAFDLAASLGFREVLLVGHIGKLIKLAGGIMNTHSSMADCRRELFCAYAAIHGADKTLCSSLMQTATTDGCLALLRDAGLDQAVMADLIEQMQLHAQHRIGEHCRIGIVVYSNTYGLLGKSE